MSIIDLLPDYYQKSEQVVELQGAFGHWTDALRAARDDLMNQLNVQSATWGLSLWETALGIKTEAGKSDEYRRTRILSRLRGLGVTTAEMIRNVAESFSNGQVEIIEHSGEYRFEVKFTGTIGIPPNMADLTAAIEEIRPAHLAYSFIYLLRTHAVLEAYTHAHLAAYTHSTLREGEM